MINIIQWNINGFYSKLEELQLIIRDHDPKVICIQETNFNKKSNPTLHNFNIYNKNRDTCNRASGGVAIMIDQSYPTKEVILQTNLEAMAIIITLPHTSITVCNVYIPNQKEFTLPDIEHIVQQLPNPYIIVGDFNSHSKTWGSYKSDSRGKIIEDLLSKDNITILNNGQPTRINQANGHPSAIDLSIANTSFSHKLEWQTLPDIYSSDHIPIKISITHPLDNTHLFYPPRWKIKKANWSLFSSLMDHNTSELHSPSKENIDTVVENFTSLIVDSAKISIGISPSKSQRPRVPWWNDEIKKSIQDKNKALKTFQNTKTQEDFIILKRYKARTRFLVKNSKASSWRNYVSSISNQTDSSNVWKKIKSIKGTNRIYTINLITDSILSSSPKEVANTLGTLFHENSSNTNYDQDFLTYSHCYANPINIVDPVEISQTQLNSPIKIKEFEDAIFNCKSLSPGPDGIPYSFIKNLPNNSKNYLLAIYNTIWENNVFPSVWRHGHIIPIAKPNKNKFLADSYRPICLLNTLCKLLEKIINCRLIWFLEKFNHLTPIQNGFRQYRSTLNNLLTIKKEIQISKLHKQSLGMINFDIAKAYDTAWRPRILHKLNKIITKGNMLNFITNFLSHRTFQVKTANTLSDTFRQENGVPQGSTISVTLFLISINDIAEKITTPCIPMLYADDFTILCRSTNANSIQQLLQDASNKLMSWSKSSGFRLSPTKTNLLIFNQKRKTQNISIKIGDHTILEQPKAKVLGVIFDSKTSWIPHIQNLKNSTTPRLNIIKKLAHTSWGAQSHILLKIHKAFILSKLDYGAPLFSTANPSHLKVLESIHNTGIRLSIGAFRSSPIQSILTISGIPSLAARWNEQTSKLAARMSRLPLDIMPHPKYMFKDIYTKYGLENIIPAEISLCPHWIFTMKINLDLHTFPKKTTCPNTFNNIFKESLSLTQMHRHIYTDASLTESHVGMAIIYDDNQIQWKLSNKCSIYTAEALAILKAIEYITSDTNHNNFTIYSDSLSTLTSLQNLHNPTDIARKIHNAHYRAQLAGKNISYTWIPGHCNIKGNERADTAAKQAHSSSDALISSLFSYSDLKNIIEMNTLQQWEKEWNKMTTKLNEIKRTIIPWSFPTNTPRKYESAINRLRIGHTHLTHSFLMKKEDPPTCLHCGVHLTVKHVLTECRAYSTEKRKLQISDHLSEILSPDPANIIKLCQFLSSTHLINLL